MDLGRLNASPADLNKLRSAGYFTVEAVAYGNIKHLTRIKGISEAKASKLLANARSLLPAANYHESSEEKCPKFQSYFISTGSRRLDRLLPPLGCGIEISCDDKSASSSAKQGNEEGVASAPVPEQSSKEQAVSTAATTQPQQEPQQQQQQSKFK